VGYSWAFAGSKGSICSFSIGQKGGGRRKRPVGGGEKRAGGGKSAASRQEGKREEGKVLKAANWWVKQKEKEGAFHLS